MISSNLRSTEIDLSHLKGKNVKLINIYEKSQDGKNCYLEYVFTVGILDRIEHNRYKIYVSIITKKINHNYGYIYDCKECYSGFDDIVIFLDGSKHLEKILHKSSEYPIELGIMRARSSYVYQNTIITKVA